MPSRAPAAGPWSAPAYSLRIALRELGRRVQFLDDQVARLDDLIVPLAAVRAPGLLSLYGVRPDTAALLLIAAGDRPERLRSEAAWAHHGRRLTPGAHRVPHYALKRCGLRPESCLYKGK